MATEQSSLHDSKEEQYQSTPSLTCLEVDLSSIKEDSKDNNEVIIIEQETSYPSQSFSDSLQDPVCGEISVQEPVELSDELMDDDLDCLLQDEIAMAAFDSICQEEEEKEREEFDIELLQEIEEELEIEREEKEEEEEDEGIDSSILEGK